MVKQSKPHLNNYTLEEGPGVNTFVILLDDAVEVGRLQTTVDNDGMIEVDGTFKDNTVYFLLDPDQDYLYVDSGKYVIIYDMEAFKKDVFEKIKEAE